MVQPLVPQCYHLFSSSPIQSPVQSSTTSLAGRTLAALQYSRVSRKCTSFLVWRRKTRPGCTDTLPSGQESMAQWEHTTSCIPHHSFYTTPVSILLNVTMPSYTTLQLTILNWDWNRKVREFGDVLLQSSRCKIWTHPCNLKHWCCQSTRKKHTRAWELFYQIQIKLELKECTRILRAYFSLKKWNTWFKNYSALQNDREKFCFTKSYMKKFHISLL